MTDVKTLKSSHKTNLQRAMTYIESCHTASLSLKTLSTIANISPYHFHRLFKAYTGETVHQFIYRTRLEKAAHKLRHTKESITSIALSTSYETPSSFSKAFKKLFAVSPTSYRQSHRDKPISPKMDSNHSIPNYNPLKPNYQTIAPQDILFCRRVGQYSIAASRAWKALMDFAIPKNLIHPDTKLIGISHDSPEITLEQNLRYDACLTFSDHVDLEDGFNIKVLPGGPYATFHHRGSYEELGVMYDAIYSEWLPASKKRLRDQPGFELYSNPQNATPETTIYIPIID